LFDKAAKDQPGSEELAFYMHILLSQGKFENALRDFDSLLLKAKAKPYSDNSDFETNGHKLNMHELSKLTLRAEILSKGRLSGLNSAEFTLDSLLGQYRCITDIYPDQFDAHSSIIDLIVNHQIELCKQQEISLSASLLDPNNLIINHFIYLGSLQDRHPRLRGPFLADIHFVSKLINAYPQFSNGFQSIYSVDIISQANN
jgi:hypothetical protein